MQRCVQILIVPEISLSTVERWGCSEGKDGGNNPNGEIENNDNKLH